MSGKRKTAMGRPFDQLRMASDPDLKQCRGPCQQVLARTDFDVDNDKADGLKAWCKQCRASKREMQAVENVQSVLSNIDGNLLATLGQAKQGGTMLPHQIQALEAIMQLIGGVDGFAMMWMQTFIAAPPGSQTRERMLNQLHKAIQTASDDGKVSKPRELMTDEELQASIEEKIKRMGLRTVEAPPEDIKESA